MLTEQLTTTSAVFVGVPMMDEQEARACVTRIKTRIDVARGELLELHDREGWRAMGYKNWETCARQEFGGSAAQMYRLLSAAQIERAIDSPIGEYPESHLREVARLDTPDQQKLALDQARAKTNGKPTAKDVRQAAAEMTAPDLPPEYDIIKRRYERHGHALTSIWDGATRRYVVRKDGGTGAVMVWDAVLSKLERIEAEPEAPAQPPPPPSYPANASAYDQQEHADIKLMRAAHDAIEACDYAGARKMLDQVQVAIYERDQVARTLVRSEATRFWTDQTERRTRFSPQAMISLTTWDRALAHIAALLEMAL